MFENGFVKSARTLPPLVPPEPCLAPTSPRHELRIMSMINRAESTPIYIRICLIAGQRAAMRIVSFSVKCENEKRVPDATGTPAR